MKIGSFPVQNNLVRKHYYILLCTIVLFHIINNIIIITADNTPLLWDGGDYFLKSLKYYDVFANFGPDFISRFNSVSTYRPPLFLLSSLPLYLIFGKSTDVAVMTNSIFLIIMVFSLFGIGRRLHSEAAGLLTAFLVTFFPIVFGLSRSYWTDFPVTAMVALSIYLLMRSDCFENRKYSLLFGISAGLGMLTKWTYFVFLAGPFAYMILCPFRSDLGQGQKPTKPLLNAVLSIFVAMAVASFWYLPNSFDVGGKLLDLAGGISNEKATRFQQLGETFGPSGIFNFKSLTFYGGKLINDQTSFFYGLLSVIFTIFWVKRGWKKSIWVLLWIIIPVIAFTLIKNKTDRNTVPMLPAIALTTSLGIMCINREGIRRWVIVLVVLIGLFQYTATSYGIPFLPAKVRYQSPAGEVIFFQQHENRSYALYRAQKEGWKADEILAAIDRSRGNKKEVAIVLIPRDAFTWMAMEYNSYLRKMPFRIIGAADDPEAVLHADYVLVKKGGFVAPWFIMGNIHRSFDLLEAHLNEFVLLKSVELPEDKNYLPIYDTKQPRAERKHGVVFSDRLQVLECSVSETGQGSASRVGVSCRLKALNHFDGDLKIVLLMSNRKMEAVFRQTVAPSPAIFGWKAGEVRSVSAGIEIPQKIAKEVFSIEIGLYDSAKRELLRYQPEYLIYQRIRSQ